MSALGRRFLTAFGLLIVAAAGLVLLGLLGRWLLPGAFGTLPPWLPEDVLWGLGLSWAQGTLGWVASLALAAVVLTFAYWLRPEQLPPSPNQALLQLAAVAILTAMVYSGITLLARPWFDARLGQLEFRHHQAGSLEEAYLAIEARGPEAQTAAALEARLDLLQRLGLLRPHQGQQPRERLDYEFELLILKAHLELDEFFRLRALPGVTTTEDDASATVDQLLTRAEATLADPLAENEFQANLWGYQAYRRLMNAVDQGKPQPPQTLARARAVVETSWSRIYERTLAADERLKASYFFRKGKSLGDYQFQNYLEAYYGFQELRKENPLDTEVERYWNLSKAKVADQVLFYQDMEVLFAVPGDENLVFVNRQSPLEVVRIGKLLDTSQGVFVQNFELLRFDATGRTLLHWTADFGRWGPQGIDFRVWDQEAPVPRFPVVRVETPGNEFNPLGTVDPPLFQPRVTISDLRVIGATHPLPQTLGTWDLLVHGEAIAALGYNPGLFQTEFLMRLTEPFWFFVVFVLVFVLAWHHRVPEPGRTWWLLVPVLPLLVHFLIESAQWAGRLAVGGLLSAWGLETTGFLVGALIFVTATAAVILAYRAVHHSLREP